MARIFANDLVTRAAQRSAAEPVVGLVVGLSALEGDPTDRFTTEDIQYDILDPLAGIGVIVAEHHGALVGYALFVKRYESAYAV